VALFAGLSGWAYPEWRPDFYPAGLSPSRMLPAYAEVFGTVEVNNTFYRTPAPEAIAGWRDQAPPDFLFSVKASRAITHRKRFADTGELLERFAELLRILGDRLGPVLFQFQTIADVAQLRDFLGQARSHFPRVVAEFRHPSWMTDETFEVLRSVDAALCATETDDGSDPHIAAHGFSYVRLRRTAYTAEELAGRLAALRELSAGDHDVFAYLKHDVENAVLLRAALAP
jgi:uncharacterized protein YecE (DUF72 family)